MVVKLLMIMYGDRGGGSDGDDGSDGYRIVDNDSVMAQPNNCNST